MFSAKVPFYSTNLITNGLIFYVTGQQAQSYPGSGTTWSDLTSSAFNLTLQNGPTFDSANGGSIVFDGTNDWAFRASALNAGNSFTASVWFNVTAIGTTQRALIGNGFPYAFGGNYGWYLTLGQATTNNSAFLSVGRDAQARVTAANTFTLNTWQQITATRIDGASTNIKLYRNGVETAYSTAGGSATGILYTTNEFYIANRYSTAPTPLPGKIGEVQIYNRVLSADEILYNFNATRGRYGV